MTATTRGWAPFLAVESATLLSGIGNGVAVVALPWLVLERTGSATAAAGLATITAIPTVIAALGAGTVVDVVGRRRVSVISDLLSLVSVALIPLLDAAIGLTYPQIVVLAVLGAVFDPAGMGAREAMVPEASARAGLDLARANGIHEAIWGAAFLLGPGLGGLLIGVIGAAETFWLTAVMFGLSAAVMASIPIPGAGPPSAQERPDSFLGGTVEGLGFLWRDKPQRVLNLLLMVMVMLYLPVEGVVLPVYFESLGQPGGLGSVLMALAGGGIAGALGYGWISRRAGPRAVFVGALGLTAVTFLPLVTLPSLAVMIPIAAIVGLAFGPVQPTINVVMQTRTPSRLRGRVVGVLTALAYAGGPLGYMAIGPVVDAGGPSAGMLVTAVGFLVVWLVAWWAPALRDLDPPPDEVDRPSLDQVPPPRPLE